MKAMPKKDLIAIMSRLFLDETIFKEQVVYIFNEFGDDYCYVDGVIELSRANNNKRAELMGKIAD